MWKSLFNMVDLISTLAQYRLVGWDREQATMFGERVRGLRDEAGLTQQALAELVGLSQNHMQLLESGKSNFR